MEFLEGIATGFRYFVASVVVRPAGLFSKVSDIANKV